MSRFVGNPDLLQRLAVTYFINHFTGSGTLGTWVVHSVTHSTLDGSPQTEVTLKADTGMVMNVRFTMGMDEDGKEQHE